ncbi:hypothetical protein LINPERPRIM_LOCUS25209 [Linum perenne]
MGSVKTRKCIILTFNQLSIFQEKVACLDDNDARLALDPHNKFRIQVAVATSEKQVAEPETELGPFSKEQANALEKLLARAFSKSQPPQQHTTDTYTGLFAKQGTHSAYLVNSQDYVNWIIDSGCSDHMTETKGLLSEYQEYPTKAGVRTADGNLSPVVGIGRVRLSRRKAPRGRLELLNSMRTYSSLRGQTKGGIQKLRELL